MTCLTMLGRGFNLYILKILVRCCLQKVLEIFAMSAMFVIIAMMERTLTHHAPSCRYRDFILIYFCSILFMSGFGR